MAIAILVGRNEEETKAYEWFIHDWKKALLALDPNLDIRIWPEVHYPAEIDYLLVWNHPIGVLNQFPQAKAIASLAAGVDHVLRDTHLNPSIPLVRVVDPFMANDIVQYVTAYVLQYIKRIPHWALKQKQKQWSKEPPFSFADKTIGIMGLGHLGSKAANILQQLGLNVVGWSNSPKILSGVKHFTGQAHFKDFLSQTHILICMLPLTNETRHILNKKTFSHLPLGSYLINVGRGDHLLEEDLLHALSSGQLEGACLDVFHQEPLPLAHPFWSHPQIQITPHIASVTNAVTAAPQILENYQRLLSGKTLLNSVDWVKGY